MQMTYTSNPHIGKVRAQAVRLIREHGWTSAHVARHLGVHRSTIGRWLHKAPLGAGRIYDIETTSSRPHHHPQAIEQEIVDRVLALRDTQRKHGPQVIHELLKREGVQVSFSTVYRILKRHRRIQERSPWKKYHRSGTRPSPDTPGTLLQMDTIHIMQSLKARLYIFTLIDVHSRWAYAKASPRLNTHIALRICTQAQSRASFPFSCIQSDHGPEFGTYFTTMVQAQGIRHRHSRVRQPNDNAHVERFNRTIQEELAPEIQRYKHNLSWLNRSITDYLLYYNTQRLHAGIHHKTPQELLEMLQRS